MWSMVTCVNCADSKPYNSFDSIVLPDFNGARARACNETRDVAVHLKHLCRAFPKSAENNNAYLGNRSDTLAKTSLLGLWVSPEGLPSIKMFVLTSRFQNYCVPRTNITRK